MNLRLKRSLGLFLALVFILLSVFHVVGAFDAWRDLAIVPTLPGQPAHYPRGLSWLRVAGALALAAVVVLARADLILRSVPKWMSTCACLVLGSVFVFRTVGEFHWLGLFRSVTGTDFAYWDAWLYTPLCLVIAVATLTLAATARSR